VLLGTVAEYFSLKKSSVAPNTRDKGKTKLDNIKNKINKVVDFFKLLLLCTHFTFLTRCFHCLYKKAYGICV
jgi:hypothetical protein